MEECRTSKKYKSGIWYVVENNGKILSSLIVYAIDSISNCRSIGIGSLATQLNERKKGYAAKLLNAIVSAYKWQYNINFFMLFAEIKIKYYEKLGFVALSDENQLYDNSVCMIHCSQQDKKYIEEKFKESNINYF